MASLPCCFCLYLWPALSCSQQLLTCTQPTQFTCLLCQYFFPFLGDDSILEVDSLEADLMLKDSETATNVPAPVWPHSSGNKPEVFQSHLDPASLDSIQSVEDDSIKVVQRDTQFVSGISHATSPPPNQVDVAKHGAFVRSIQFRKITDQSGGKPIMGRSALQCSRTPQMLHLGNSAKTGFYRDMSPIEENRTTMTNGNDSIVTESLLHMTSFSEEMPAVESVDGSVEKITEFKSKPPTDPDPQRKKSVKKGSTEDMDKVIAELTAAVMKSRNVTTLTRAMKNR